MAEGKTQRESYAIINPDGTQPHVMGNRFYHSPGVKERLAEIKEEIQTRSVLKICRKRELLRQMAEGVTPTKVIRRANGQVEAIFDRHLALVTDAKVAGEFAPEKMEVAGPTLKLTFDILGRNTALTPELEAKYIDITTEAVGEGEPAPVPLPELPPHMEEDYSKYIEAKVDPEQEFQL